MTVIPHISTKAMALAEIPKNLHKHVDPKAPFPLRDMGAKALAPGLTPPDIAIILFQLQFDPEERLRKQALQTFNDLPDELSTPMAQASLPAPVLDFCARRWLGKRDALLEHLIRNSAIDDATVCFLASKGNDRLTEIVAENQVRLERTPAIIEHLYQNANTHQSLIDRVLEFAQRQSMDLGNLPGVKQALNAMNKEGATVQDDGPDDATFANILKGSVARAEAEEASGVTTADIENKLDEFSELLDQALNEQQAETDFNKLAEDAAASDEGEEEEKRFISRQVLIQKMKISQKVRLASLGSREDRALLVRDPNRLVHMAAILSPKVQDSDLKDFAGNKELPKTIINYIATRKSATRDYGMLVKLCNNPKLDLARGIRMINHLRNNDLRSVSKSRNVTPQMAKAAKALLKKRTGGRG